MTTMTIMGLRREIRRRRLAVSLDMCPTILECINPEFTPLRLTRDEERRILGEFHRIITVFATLQHEGRIKRKNFLSYHFVLGKITSRLRMGGFMRKFLLFPKCKSTTLKQEKEWRKIRQRYKEDYTMSS